MESVKYPTETTNAGQILFSYTKLFIWEQVSDLSEGEKMADLSAFTVHKRKKRKLLLCGFVVLP